MSEEEFLEAAFEAARDDLPDAEALRSLEAALEPEFSGPGGGSGGAAPPASVPPWAWAAVLLVAAFGGLGLWLATQGDPPSSIEHPGEVESASAVASVRSSESESVQGARPAEREEAVLLPESGERRTPSERSEAIGRTAPSERPSELALLSEARAQLSSDPRAALATTRRHQRFYPRGVFAQEREVIAIDALARLGRARRVQRRARGFLHRYPESAHRDRVRLLLESVQSSSGE